MTIFALQLRFYSHTHTYSCMNSPWLSSWLLSPWQSMPCHHWHGGSWSCIASPWSCWTQYHQQGAFTSHAKTLDQHRRLSQSKQECRGSGIVPWWGWINGHSTHCMEWSYVSCKSFYQLEYQCHVLTHITTRIIYKSKPSKSSTCTWPNLLCRCCKRNL